MGRWDGAHHQMSLAGALGRQCHRNILELRSTAHLCTLSALDRVSETYARTQLAGQEMRARKGRGGGWDRARLENSSPAALGHQCHCQSRELGSTAYLRTGKVPNRVREAHARTQFAGERVREASCLMARSNGAHLDLSPEYLRGAGLGRAKFRSQAVGCADSLGIPVGKQRALGRARLTEMRQPGRARTP